MEGLSVRPAISSDISRLIAFDHHYSTDHVWQMGFSSAGGEIGVSFREVRLPRAMRVEYPRDPSRLPDDWNQKLVILVAELDQAPVGYVCLVEGPAAGTSWATDVVVDLRNRRQGVGTRLLSAAQDWSRERRYARLFLEMQTKNHPATSLARKSGFEFAGYSDRYYPDQDIAIFFVRELRA